MMRRTARIAATAALAASMAAAVAGTAPAAASPDGGAAPPGKNLYAVYPTKAECLSVGRSGVPERWDEFDCVPWVDPLAAPRADAAAAADNPQWALWTTVWV